MSDTNERGTSRTPIPIEPEAGSEALADELLWATGGHASDVVLTALADGQSHIVPRAVRLHVEHCTSCTTHLGHAALLSLHTGIELTAKAQHDRASKRRPLPRLAIALGLAIAAIGLLPSLLDPHGGIENLRTFATRDVLLFLRGVGTLARRLDDPGSHVGTFVTYAMAAMLVVMGMGVARILPKAQKETPR